METNKLQLKTSTGGFSVEVTAGAGFEEDILEVLDRYVDCIQESEFY